VGSLLLALVSFGGWSEKAEEAAQKEFKIEERHQELVDAVSRSRPER
jgi:hypothetical protein